MSKSKEETLECLERVQAEGAAQENGGGWDRRAGEAVGAGTGGAVACEPGLDWGVGCCWRAEGRDVTGLCFSRTSSAVSR